MKVIELLQALCDQQVQFVIVGGFAVQLHGYQRSTYDIDLVLAMDEENLTRFIATTGQFGLVPVAPVPIESLKNARLIEQWHREKGMLAFALREPGISGSVVDVLVKPEVPFEALNQRAVTGELFSRKIKIASIDDLLTMKRIADRPKDRLDIAALERIKAGEDPNV